MYSDESHIKLKKIYLKNQYYIALELIEKKNLHLLVKYAKNNPDTNLIIIGEITDKKYFHQISI